MTLENDKVNAIAAKKRFDLNQLILIDDEDFEDELIIDESLIRML